MTGYAVHWSGGLVEAVSSASSRASTEMQRGLDDIGDAFLDNVKARIKGSRLPSTVSIERTRDSVEIGSDSPMAALIERGRRPGRMPSPAVLQRSLGVSHKVAVERAEQIAKRGTRGRKYFEKTADEVRSGAIPRIMSETARRIGELG